MVRGQRSTFQRHERARPRRVRLPTQAVHGQRRLQTADVISVDGNTPNLPGIREKFVREHTHSEDEVRVFVEGQGFF